MLFGTGNYGEPHASPVTQRRENTFLEDKGTLEAVINKIPLEEISLKYSGCSLAELFPDKETKNLFLREIVK